MRTALLISLVSSFTAFAGTCTPNYDAWQWYAASTTMDDELTPLWCGTPGAYEHYWDTLNLTKKGKFWNKQAALDGLVDCSTNSYVVRLINAAVFADQMVYHRGSKTLGAEQYQWLTELISDHSDDSYVAKPCDYTMPTEAEPKPKNYVARNWDDGSATDLGYPFFAHRNAPQRASTLSHEAVHDWEGHLADDQCAAEGSCDDAFGNSNAQTFQIVFLNDAISTWRKGADNEWVVANWGDGTCGYLPYLSPQARADSVALMQDKLKDNFHTVPAQASWPRTAFWGPNDAKLDYGGWTFNADVTFAARWPCENVCNPADYDTGGAKACNVDYQPSNAGINQNNKSRCIAANASLGAGVKPSEYAAIIKAFAKNQQKCTPGASEQYLAGVCTAASANANTAAQIETAWSVPDDVGTTNSELGLQACVANFCAPKMTEGIKASARNGCYEYDDFLGCTRALCGALQPIAAKYGATSSEYLDAVNCRRAFFEGESESTFHSSGTCEVEYQACKDASAYAEWKSKKAAGQCALVETTTAPAPTTLGFRSEYALSDLPTASSWSVHTRLHPKTIHGGGSSCDSTFMLCRVARDIAATKATGLISLNPVFENPKGPLNLPRPPTMEDVSSFHVFESLVESARIATGKITDTRVSAQTILTAWTRTPEAEHAISQMVGPQTFFAVHGVSGRSRTFGPAAAAAPMTASLTLHQGTAEQQAALDAYLALVPMRQRVESQATQNLLTKASTVLSEEALFGHLKSIGSAQSAMELERSLDALQVAVDAFP